MMKQEARKVMADLEAHGTRRCLICAKLNPCPQHSLTDQQGELARNDAAIADIRARRLAAEEDWRDRERDAELARGPYAGD